MKIVRCVFLFIMMFYHVLVFSSEPFKTGLVLSGGGAKGLAHIGLLKIIDSLEIKIDYITGTSMGSIVGGLYAIGYSADSIKNIMTSERWDLILSNQLTLKQVHFNEKDYYENKLVSLPIINKRLQIPRSVIEGQYLSMLLNKYFFQSRNICDFNDYPIPIHIIATDVISGQKVVIQEGYLPKAIRASMAIPALFSPVYYDDKLLVDGGAVRNFPVEEVKSMGADFVIGSYTGFVKKKSKSVDNMFNSIYRSLTIDAVRRADIQKNITNILLDFSESLQSYKTQDFNKAQEIIDLGVKEARKLIPSLIKLKALQTSAGLIYKKIELIRGVDKPIKNIKIYNIDETLIKGRESEEVCDILAIDNLQNLDTFEYVRGRIQDLYAFNNYDKVDFTYTASLENSRTKDINIFLTKAKPSLAIGVHFDTDESVGIALKYLHRDLMLNKSRFILGVDLSSYYKANLNYLKYLDKNNRWFTTFDYRMMKEKNTDFILKLISEVDFFSVPTLFNYKSQIKLGLGCTINKSSVLSTSLGFFYDSFDKENGKYSKLNFLLNNSKENLIYRHNYLGLSLNYSQNSLDTYFATTCGNKLDVGISCMFDNHFYLYKPHEKDKLGMEYYNYFKTNQYDKSYTDKVIKICLEEQFNIPITKRLTLKNQTFLGVHFGVFENGTFHFVKNEDFIFYDQTIKLGGYNTKLAFLDILPFAGFNKNEISFNNVVSNTISAQYNVINKLYVSPIFSLGKTLEGSNFHEDSDFVGYFVGVGLDLDYYTFLGPMKLGVYLNDQYISPSLYFSIGYNF